MEYSTTNSVGKLPTYEDIVKAKELLADLPPIVKQIVLHPVDNFKRRLLCYFKKTQETKKLSFDHVRIVESINGKIGKAICVWSDGKITEFDLYKDKRW